jgi:hypothetical protein
MFLAPDSLERNGKFYDRIFFGKDKKHTQRDKGAQGTVTQKI